VTDREIQQIITQLDDSVPKDGARLLINIEDTETNECELIGNRNGYLRAGLEFLRAATVPLEPNAFITSIEFNYLVPSRGFLVKRLSRQQDPEAALPPLKRHTWKDKAAGIGCLTVATFLFICTLIGIEQIGVWIFGK
jgi:hypothetical protein